VQEADTGATAPATGVGLGKGAPDEVGEEAAEALAECEGVGCEALLLLPQATNITAATSPRNLRNRMRAAILLLTPRITE
jgi:hypothetical protein